MSSRVVARISLLLGALVTVGALSGPFFANATHLPRVVDPDDVRGLLDLQGVEVNGEEATRWKITTYPYWRASRIWDRGYFLVSFDTFGERRFDYYALVRSDGYRLLGELYRDRRTKPDYSMGSLDVWRPNRRSLKVKVPLARLNIPARRESYRWQVRSLFSGSKCPRVCIDQVPDRGAVREPLIDPLPTTTTTTTTTTLP